MLRDAKGNVWELTLDFVSCRRVRDLVHVNLLSMNTAVVFATLSDPIAVAEIVYAICKPQADARRISEPEFLRLMEIEPNSIADVLVRKLSDFFRRLGQPAKAAQMTTAQERATKLAAMTTPEELERITNETFNWMQSQIRRNSSGEPLTNSQASSESIPTSPG